MHFLAPLTVLSLFLSAAAIPITPSAPSLQRRAEQFRLKGLREYEIAEALTLSPLPTHHRTPLLTYLHTLLQAYTPTTLSSSPASTSTSPDAGANPEIEFPYAYVDTDTDASVSGDIAPGSLDAPQILPQPAVLVPASALGRALELLRWRGAGREDGEFAYEGREGELRRPTGMRHWGAKDDIWRLF